ncbi:MAG: sugar phosphate isomerase/epimerase [Defluviitaleaceae bacterium]|nr:sugar phosphate isomerase/epimerase [Defluviitaleaceae bacterium]
MRFGGPAVKKSSNPEEWVANMKEMGYTACFFPLDYDEPLAKVDAYVNAAREADILIAEVGVWNNPLTSDLNQKKENLQQIKDHLAFADYVGAACCVNIAGSKGTEWDGPHKDNFSKACFEEIVADIQEIVDAVKPTKTYYTLETMPWIYPYDADSYLSLIKAVDRECFAVHLDVINMITSPYRYYHNAEFTQECFDKLGPYIKSCHAKDVIMTNKMLSHIDETNPGLGEYDFTKLIECIRKLDNIPMLMEHMRDPQEIMDAAAYLKKLF